ncbi:unnamed protein product [Cuscuta europaea]|uniref:CBS domain-containing protein n=1 Tax=Cuscuta europaea TaxID=41803 RepID=A0A9P1E6H8_CUSEU|nr:unnamed protein product [Cuscuta europaea]
MQSTGQSCYEAADSKRLLLLREKKVMDLVPRDKRRRLVEVPYTATLADTMNTLLAHRVAAVPVAAPPGQWIGAGGSMILEHDKSTGAARKHYIGMVTMLDVLAHIAGDGEEDLDLKMAAQVSSIIGHCLETLTLWTLNPAMSLVDCMEVFSKGIHRAMVPLESLQQSESLAGVELVESASSYGMLSQMDVLKFLREYNRQHPEGELKHIMSCRIKVEDDAAAVFGISDESTVMDAIKCMKAALLTALPILHSPIAIQEHHSQLFNGKNMKVRATFSATDLRACPIPLLKTCLQWKVVDFLRMQEVMRPSLVAGTREMTLGEAVEKVVCNGVHRIWVVDRHDLLQGLLSLTDILKLIRLSLLGSFATPTGKTSI